MISHRPLPAVPTRWREVRLHDLGWLARYGLQAIAELAHARRRFGALDLGDLRTRNGQGSAELAASTPADPQMLQRVAFVMPRVARFMPFRSDCLIQATGAQGWLARHGVQSRIVIGVKRPEDGTLAAHAWLEQDGTIITGGDVSQYTVLL